MKKKVIIFSIILIIALSIPLCFAFASEECEHQYKDDGDCTTPATCSLCGEVAYVKESHSFDKISSYTFENSNLLLGGKKTVKCSNKGCVCKEEQEVLPFVDPLGYAIKQEDGISTLIASYAFNATEIDSFSKLSASSIEYGVICYIPSRLGTDAPLSPDGTPDVTVIKSKLTGYSGISDLAIPKIPDQSYSEEIVFSAYLIIGKDVYYIQDDEFITDYTKLVSVSCNDVIDALSTK